MYKYRTSRASRASIVAFCKEMGYQRNVPKFFESMLCHTERNTAYEKAIEEVISAFAIQNGRAPTVVDIGCGTGMLTIFCIKHGAASVVAVDCNKDMVRYLAPAALEMQDGWYECSANTFTNGQQTVEFCHGIFPSKSFVC